MPGVSKRSDFYPRAVFERTRPWEFNPGMGRERLGAAENEVLGWSLHVRAAFGRKRKGQTKMVSAAEIVRLQDRLTKEWHDEPDAPAAGTSSAEGGEWLALVVRQHRANFDLWHIEDKARTPGASDREIALVKRGVDVTNQLRNDLIEELDRKMLGWMEERGLPNPDAPLSSEAPGMMIDRLSILALKIYHTKEEAERLNAPPGHAERNRGRLAILEEQREDLAGCLDALWRDTLGGARRFKRYRQLKMYNDPTLNPAIYEKDSAPRGN